MTSPYVVGSDIVLTSLTHETIKAKIISLETMTLSCVMVVKLDSSPGLHILKLYDRRFAQQLRRDEKAAPWDIQLERCYQTFLGSGEQSTLFNRWHHESSQDHYWRDEDREQWSQAILETYLQFLCQRAYRTEQHAYDLMHDIQGACVPRLHHEVILGSTDIKTTQVDEFLHCPGIILQYIPGFPLTDLAKNVDSQHWQRLCDTAIDIIHKVGDRGICNKDVKTRSFILTKDTDNSIPRIFMIDFGLCVFRKQATSEDEFREWQADQDEEGAVGCVMERYLKGGYNYHLSNRAMRLLEDFKSEELEENPL